MSAPLLAGSRCARRQFGVFVELFVPLTLEQLQNIDSRFEADVTKVWDYEVSVERKSSIGGTSRASVEKQIDDILAFAKTLVV